MCTRSNGNAIAYIDLYIWNCQLNWSFRSKSINVCTRWQHTMDGGILFSTGETMYVCAHIDGFYRFSSSISCNFLWKCCSLFLLWTREQLLRTKVNCLVFYSIFFLFFLKRTMTSMTLVRALNRIYVFLNHSNDGIITLY